jgi:hypothetical protein
MSTARGLIVVAGYLVRFPLGGYAWQAAHYLRGLDGLGYDVWFHEDTGYYAPAFNAVTRKVEASYDYGIIAARNFLTRIGFGGRWGFVDTENGEAYGPGGGRAEALIREADLVVNLGRLNRLPVEQRAGRPAIYIDLDPGYTQLKVLNGDKLLRATLDEHTQLFTFGENIGTSRSSVPSAGYAWRATRQPVVLDLWPRVGGPGRSYTTVGQWNSQGRDLTYGGETFRWCKRTEWLRCLDLPARTGATFELAMDVDRVPGDPELLTAHGWKVIEPIALSADPWSYRDYIRRSRGEFTVAKDMNVRLRSGWFSDRAACYLAAGRPVVEQDTGFGDVVPVGPGLHAFRTVEEAAEAVRSIEADYERASAQATAVAREYFAADKVLGRLLHEVGL